MKRSWAAVALLVGASAAFVAASSRSGNALTPQARPSPTDSSSSPSPSSTPSPPGVSPAANDFGTVCVGTASSPFSFTVDNPDPVDDLIVQKIDGPWPFVAGPAASATVAPGDSTTFPVTYHADASGSQAATVQLTTNHGPATVDVSGNGLDRQLSVAPTTLAFGGQLTKTSSAPRTVTIANTGADPLVVAAPVLAGPNAAEFAMSQTPSFTLPGNTAQRIAVVFTPPVDGDASATITVTTNACVRGRRTIVLTGTGAEPGITVRPTSIQPSAVPGAKSAPAIVTVSSSGGVPLHVSKIALDGDAAKAFTMTGAPHLPATLAPGDSVVLQVTFAAAKPGAQPPPSAAIDVASDDPKFPLVSVAITGGYLTPTPTPSARPSPTVSAAPRPSGRHGGGLSGYTSVIVVGLLVAAAFVALWLFREEKMRRVLRRVTG